MDAKESDLYIFFRIVLYESHGCSIGLRFKLKCRDCGGKNKNTTIHPHWWIYEGSCHIINDAVKEEIVVTSAYTAYSQEILEYNFIFFQNIKTFVAVFFSSFLLIKFLYSLYDPEFSGTFVQEKANFPPPPFTIKKEK